MESSELSYWQGVSGWAILLGTTLVTAFWLEAKPVANVLKWEVVRLGSIALLLLSSYAGLSMSLLFWASVYGAMNLVLLAMIVRTPHMSSAAPAV